MKRLLIIICVLACTFFAKAKDRTQYVNPLMGSQSTFELSTGNTYPAIARPWGMNFWTPQTGKMGDGWQYTYTANKIRGFKQTHQPSPWINDYGQFSIMPIVGKPVFDEEKRASWFAHKGETATPYYYKVYLAEHDVVTEMVPTERAVLFRFTFPENDHSYVVVDAFDKGSYIKVIPEENKIIGYTTRNSGGVPENFKNYFIIEFDKPFTYKATVANGNLQENVAEQTTDHAGAIIGFQTRKGEQVHARIASSFISFEQAAANMKELGKDNIEQLARKGKEAWNQVLGKIEVEGGNLDQYRTFYSCLYRSLLFPRKFYELDAAGQPVHYSPYNGQVLPGYMYTDTGFWDTFRCLFPLLNLMYPSVNKEMQEGLINTYKESGFFPEWASPGHRGCMVGNNSASILVDAYMKGYRDFDVNEAYKACLRVAEYDTTGIKCPPLVLPHLMPQAKYWKNKIGYVPCDKDNEAVAKALEYAYNDWCISVFAESLGDVANHDKYAKFAEGYKTYFDPTTRFMRGLDSEGNWRTPFSPRSSTHRSDDYCEGTAWQWTWFVPHQIDGLVELMGGREGFINKLDSLFTADSSLEGEMTSADISGLIGQYAHGNEPSHHIIHMYNYVDQPYKTQELVDSVLHTLYFNDPNGLSGNEDCGQMSAWYILNAMGFYQVCPGNPVYSIGRPLFNKATVNLKDGKKFTVIAKNNSRENKYIQSMVLNGKALGKPFFTHQDIVNGGTLELTMGDQIKK